MPGPKLVPRGAEAILAEVPGPLKARLLARIAEAMNLSMYDWQDFYRSLAGPHHGNALVGAQELAEERINRAKGT